ncbi:MAG: DUF2188 domain-containing protein [Bacteroidetes bacterium]|jgi:hypothetical protein|nr:DUF2188 domain-containing protein [Bacteroidota bacterium]
MPKINESSFWYNLLKKILKQVLRKHAKKNKTHNQHVVTHEDGWAVRGAGNERLTATYKYQDDAIERAKDIARNYKSSVIIHRTDGTIRDRISYKKG